MEHGPAAGEQRQEERCPQGEEWPPRGPPAALATRPRRAPRNIGRTEPVAGHYCLIPSFAGKAIEVVTSESDDFWQHSPVLVFSIQQARNSA